ncbi:MAG: D-alanyl-D-alanine carboxypeptidase family protein [Undibacterium sp.]|nr:D-alanyl-D-alanine carboxypeptidase family protein [Opitutaceae bacterium]
MPPSPPTGLHADLGLPADYAIRRGLVLQSEPDLATLVTIAHTDDHRPIQLTPATAAAWAGMHLTARAAGLTLIPVSGFRSIARQAAIIRAHLDAGRVIDEILTLVAAPGYSEHHTGRAIDITAPDDPPLVEGFALTPASTWLTIHAASFGFHLSFPRNNPHGIAYEPWHWCWRPPA